MKAILRYFGWSVLAIAAGAAVGAGWSWYVCSNTHEEFFDNQWPAVIPGQSSPIAALVGVSEHELETPLKPGESCTREFLVRNDGDAELEVSARPLSEMVSVDLSESVKIRPGTTYPIAVTVMAPQQEGDFIAEVEMVTNDPDPQRRQMKLVVRGRVEADGNNEQ